MEGDYESRVNMMAKFIIDVDDLSDGKVIALLQEHRADMLKYSPQGSVHALDVEGMKHPRLTFWSAYIDGVLVGCVALMFLDNKHAELKSMKVSDCYIGKGVGRRLLNYVLEQAQAQGLRRVSLETGTMDAFIPARTLYESRGFQKCLPFAAYQDDPNSVCMSVELNESRQLSN